jgi:hypothetical protein
MNISAIRVLLLEQASRTYQPALMSCAGIIGTGISVFVYLNRIDNPTALDIEAASGISLAGITLSVGLYMLGCLFAFGDDKDLQLDMPRYLLRLPVKTSTLVFCRMGFDVVSISLLTAFAILIHHVALDIELTNIELFARTVATFATLMAFFRMVAWAIGKSGPVLTIIGGGVLYNILSRLFEHYDLWPREVNGYLATFSLLCIACSCAVSLVFVHLHRKGSLAFMEHLSESVFGNYRSVETELPPFASKEQAMRWYETRRQTRIYPGMAVGFFVFIFLFGALKDIPAMIEPHDYPLEVQLVVIGEILFVTAAGSLLVATFLTSGIFLFQNQRAHMGGAKTFLFIRPATTNTLANARLLALLRSVVVASIPFLMIAAAVYVADSQSSESSTFRGFIDHYTSVDGLIIAALMIVGCIAALWSVLWLSNLVAFLVVFAICTMPLEYLPMFAEVHEMTRIQYSLRATAAVMFLLVIPLSYFVKRKCLISNRTILYTLVAVPVLAGGILVAANYENIAEGNSIDYTLLTYTVPALVLLPITPLLTTPLFLHWARHR